MWKNKKKEEEDKETLKGRKQRTKGTKKRRERSASNRMTTSVLKGSSKKRKSTFDIFFFFCSIRTAPRVKRGTNSRRMTKESLRNGFYQDVGSSRKKERKRERRARVGLLNHSREEWLKKEGTSDFGATLSLPFRHSLLRRQQSKRTSNRVDAPFPQWPELESCPVVRHD
jgi:hypothetical protein